MTGAAFVAGIGVALRVAVVIALFGFGVAVGLAVWFVAAWGWLLTLAFGFLVAGVAGAV